MGSERTPNVGVLIGNIETPYARTLLQGMMEAADALPANLHVFPGMYERAYIGTMRKADHTTENFMFSRIFSYATSQKLDRLILSLDTIREYAPEGFLAFLRSSFGALPTLVLESAEESPHLLVDSAAGMRSAVEHLITRHGYRRIGYIGGTEGNYGAKVKLETFRAVMAEHGLETPPDAVLSGDYTLHSGLKAAETLLERHPDIEAICCANDWMAMGCCQGLKKSGKEPGRDVAVTGFDDVTEAARSDPALSTVRAHIAALGYEAVEKVCALSAKDGAVAPLSAEPTFVVRNSCGCGFSNINAACTGKGSAEGKNRAPRPKTAEAWLDLLVKRVMLESGSRADEADIRAALGGIVSMVCQAFCDPTASLSIAAFREAIRPIETGDAGRESLPAVFNAVQYFLMSLMKDCPDVLAPRLIHFAQRVLHYTIHSYDTNTHEINDRQKKRLRFVSSMARDILQQDDKKAERLWRKLFFSVKNLKLGNLWIFALDDPHPMNPKLDMEAPWDEMKLVGWQVERDIKIYDEKDRPEAWRIPRAHLAARPRSIVYFPLFAGREVYGVMAAETDLKTLPTIFAISIQTGTALQYIFLEREQKRLIRILNAQSKEYEQKATQDELTGLLNRFGFISRVNLSITGHASERAILAFADLDHLKHINDTLGHAAGDAAITTAADLLRQGFGDGAMIGRMGGDEFVVFSCLSEDEEPRDLIDRVRSLSAAYNEKSKKPYYVEISLGVTEFRCGKNINLSDLLGQADECLYEAKQKRRTTSIRQK